VACFPVYRTYVSSAGATESDRQMIDSADMADLQPAFLDNLIYLTTKEKAERSQKEATKRLKEQLQ